MSQVKGQFDADEVYRMLSQRISFENRLLRNELHNKLQDVKEDLKRLDEKINALGLKASSLEVTGTYDAERTDDLLQEQTKSLKNDIIQEFQKELTILQKGFSSEKQYVRKLESLLLNINNTAAENIQNMSKQFEDRQVQLDQINEKVSDVSSKVTENKLNINKQFEQYSNIDSFMTEKWQSVNDLLEKNEKKNNLKLTNLDSSLKALNNTMNSTYNQLTLKLERHKVAFSASLGKSYESTEVEDSSEITCIFKEVIYQNDNSYNHEDGIFTCPEAGVYMFSVVLTITNPATDSPFLLARLYVDSQAEFVVAAQSYHTQQVKQASNLVILSLNKGQKVWVEILSFGKVTISSSSSTFSGTMLYN